MPHLRTNTSGKRLRDLVAATLDIFSRQGCERSLVADVAKAMGVSRGIFYLYVAGKAALFALEIRHAAARAVRYACVHSRGAPRPLAASSCCATDTNWQPCRKSPRANTAARAFIP